MTVSQVRWVMMGRKDTQTERAWITIEKQDEEYLVHLFEEYFGNVTKRTNNGFVISSLVCEWFEYPVKADQGRQDGDYDGCV